MMVFLEIICKVDYLFSFLSLLNTSFSLLSHLFTSFSFLSHLITSDFSTEKSPSFTSSIEGDSSLIFSSSYF